MLEQVLVHLNNWFLVRIHRGEYTIHEGSVELPFLLDGQYFRIVGSVFNDGLHKYDGDLVLMDETFNGAVWALAIPQPLVKLVEEIEKWQEKYGEGAASPYVSESFGGYTYTKAGSTDGQSAPNWQSAFRAQLSRWRKI